MSQTARIREIIAEHLGQGAGAVLLEGAIRARAGDGASQEDVDAAIAFSRDIIHAVPVLIDRVREAADAHGIGAMIDPMLVHAERYFVNPADALPERVFGELGLLDDAYLALSVIKLVQAERDPLIEIDLGPPLSFLEGILGDDVLAALTEEKRRAFAALLSAVETLTAESEAKQKRQQAAAADARRRAEVAETERRSADAELARRRPPDTVPSRPRPAGGGSSTGAGAHRRQCGACSGMGTVTCSSCGGMGSHTVSSTRVDWEGNTEYVTDYVPCGCAGGRVVCGTCGGAGYSVESR